MLPPSRFQFQQSSNAAIINLRFLLRSPHCTTLHQLIFSRLWQLIVDDSIVLFDFLRVVSCQLLPFNFKSTKFATTSSR